MLVYMLKVSIGQLAGVAYYTRGSSYISMPTINTTILYTMHFYNIASIT